MSSVFYNREKLEHCNANSSSLYCEYVSRGGVGVANPSTAFFHIKLEGGLKKSCRIPLRRPRFKGGKESMRKYFTGNSANSGPVSLATSGRIQTRGERSRPTTTTTTERRFSPYPNRKYSRLRFIEPPWDWTKVVLITDLLYPKLHHFANPDH